MTQSIIVASKNQGKIREIRDMASKIGLNADGLPDHKIPEPEEPFDTFRENALHKARYYSQKTGSAVLADDSGIEVDALDGAPGVYSARYAGAQCDDDANNQKLLAQMQGIEARGAQFRCVLAYVDASAGIEQTFDGIVRGTIDERCSGSGGFGYDVLFIPDGYSQSFGQLDSKIKHQISHRSEALHKFFAWIGSQAS